MAPHGVYRCRDEDNWVAIACRHDDDWRAFRSVAAIDELDDPRYDTLAGRLADQDRLDEVIGSWTAGRVRWDIARDLQAAGVPAAAVTRPSERIDGDVATAGWGLWPMVDHPVIGGVRVDGQPVRMSKTDWWIEQAAPTLGQHNRLVLAEVLGLSDAEIDELDEQGVI
jgi:crotonobetainyl-CoA:carnitine CoA-transferase CaiB-like acyl-CoA transferase